MTEIKPKHSYVQKINELPKREVELLVEIPWSEVEKERENVLSRLKKEVEVKGFRKGAAPEKKVIEEVGEHAFAHEMAQSALEKAYPEILKEEEIDAIGRPSISITKIAEGNPLSFKITMARMPEISLPDYKALAKEVNGKSKEKAEVTDKDVDETIKHLREQWAKRDAYQEALEKAAPKDGQAEHKKNVDPSSIKIDEKDWPELNDEFVKKLGDFKDVEDFKEKMKENLLKEKEAQTQEKHRIALLEAIHKDTKADIPEILIEGELSKMLEQFRADVTRAGFKLEEYLEQAKKTVEDLKKEWRKDAEKRAETQLILNKIAETEKITAPEDRVTEEVEKLVQMYKDADPLRARVYIESIMTNEEVFKFLETL